MSFLNYGTSILVISMLLSCTNSHTEKDKADSTNITAITKKSNNEHKKADSASEPVQTVTENQECNMGSDPEEAEGIKNFLRIEYPDWEEMENRAVKANAKVPAFQYAKEDLNDDGQPEYIVSVFGYMMGGTGGSPIYVLNSSFEKISTIEMVKGSRIYIDTRKNFEWKNLIVQTGGGGLKLSYAVLPFLDGVSYPEFANREKFAEEGSRYVTAKNLKTFKSYFCDDMYDDYYPIGDAQFID